MNKTIKDNSSSLVTTTPESKLIELAENSEALELLSAAPPVKPLLDWKSSSVWQPFEASASPKLKDGVWSTMLHDLLHNLDETAYMLRYALLHTDWLNAYLLAAGMNQIIEDYLHPDPLFLGKAAKYLEKIEQPGGRLLSYLARTIGGGLSRLNEWTSKTREIVRIQHQTADLVADLAGLVLSADSIDQASLNKLVNRGEQLVNQLQGMPESLRSEVIRLPSCFQSFDQQPGDIRRIVETFTLHWTDDDQPIYLIGIRTSGSYLAPLYAAMLKASGYNNITQLTLRPGKPLTRYERMILRQLALQRGLALVCDDPPITGATLIKTAEMLEHSGVQSSRIVLLLQLFEDSAILPPSLYKYPSILMTWKNWSIQQNISLDNVRAVLSKACAPNYQIDRLDSLPYAPDQETRQHVSAEFRVKLLNPVTNETLIRLVQVKGIGLGYFGEHILEISEQLPAYSPVTIAVQDGLIYREILPDSHSLALVNHGQQNKWISHLVRYIHERSQQLPVRADTSLQLYGRTAAWEVASNLLSRAFGQAWLLARLPLVDPYVKAVLHTVRPSIIDGDMTLQNWFSRETIDSPLIKLDLAERDFSHTDLFTYDPVYDLADLSLDINDVDKHSQVRGEYEQQSGEKISPERWMLYQLVHLWDQERQKKHDENFNFRRMARVLQSYYEEIFFEEITSVAQGPVCALDVDGVLETNQLDFPSLTATSAKSLRALAKHGYRVILVTGRSVDEVRDRCVAYHLAGGVAEYGAVLYDHTSGQIVSLLTEDDFGTLYRLRARLSNTKGVYLDPSYRNSVRVYQLDRHGQRSGLNEDLINDLLDEPNIAGLVTAIEGQSQTDFVIARVNKGMGVKEWLARFGRGSQLSLDDPCETRPISLAVGDSTADIPMLALALLAFVPKHAHIDTGPNGFHQADYPYQHGFEQAVTALLEHTPGSCPTCQMEPLTQQTEYMLHLLSIQEDGLVKMLPASLQLYWRKLRINHVSSK